jgi:SAM-dependent methyltransferase
MIKQKERREKVHFDDYTESYNKILSDQLSFFDSNDEYFSEYKIRILKQFVDISPKKILEYGCGVGRNLKYLQNYFQISKIYGCDISKKSIELARKNHPTMNFFLLGEDSIKEEFDLIFIALVFHHIHQDLHKKTLIEINKMLSENGNLFIFEHNPFNPITRFLVNTCPFDSDAVLITKRSLEKLLRQSGFQVGCGRYTLYFPAFLKKLRVIEPLLGFIPLGGQYFIKALKHRQTH